MKMNEGEDLPVDPVRQELIERGPLYETMLRYGNEPEEIEQMTLEYPMEELEFLLDKANWVFNATTNNEKTLGDYVRDSEAELYMEDLPSERRKINESVIKYCKYRLSKLHRGN